MFSIIGAYASDSDDDDKSPEPAGNKTPNDLTKLVQQTSVGNDLKQSTRTEIERIPDVEPIKSRDELIDDDDDDYCYYENGNPPQSRSQLATHPYSSNDSNSDDDGSNSDADTKSESASDQKHNPISLDNPFRTLGNPAGVNKNDSVFQIQFLEDEHQKSEALQKHVKMTSDLRLQDKINGKKICWNFRKGKCRFGHNCQYAHDSDILITKKASEITDLKPTSGSSKAPAPASSSAAQIKSASFTIEKKASYNERKKEEVVDPNVVISSVKKQEKRSNKYFADNDDDNNLEDTKDNGGGRKLGKKGKKRPGLSQTLVPGKKVMKTYYKNKDS